MKLACSTSRRADGDDHAHSPITYCAVLCTPRRRCISAAERRVTVLSSRFLLSGLVHKMNRGVRAPFEHTDASWRHKKRSASTSLRGKTPSFRSPKNEKCTRPGWHSARFRIGSNRASGVAVESIRSSRLSHRLIGLFVLPQQVREPPLDVCADRLGTRAPRVRICNASVSVHPYATIRDGLNLRSALFGIHPTTDNDVFATLCSF